MSEFKLPHVEDLRTDATLIRGLQEDFKAIEQEDKDDDQALSDEVADRKKGDDDEKAARQSADDGLEKRIKKLEDNSATHGEVKAAKDEWKNKIEHVALGTDYETVEQAVMQILKEKGMI